MLAKIKPEWQMQFNKGTSSQGRMREVQVSKAGSWDENIQWRTVF